MLITYLQRRTLIFERIYFYAGNDVTQTRHHPPSYYQTSTTFFSINQLRYFDYLSMKQQAVLLKRIFLSGSINVYLLGFFCSVNILEASRAETLAFECKFVCEQQIQLVNK